MKVHYLEIVTPDPDGLCQHYVASIGATFGEPVMELGGARVAPMTDGGLLGIRAPLRDTEGPTVRPYFLVSDIDEALASAASTGGEIAMPSTHIPSYGHFAILIREGIETGLWQLEPEN